jgi:hypothetical protein
LSLFTQISIPNEKAIKIHCYTVAGHFKATKDVNDTCGYGITYQPIENGTNVFGQWKSRVKKRREVTKSTKMGVGDENQQQFLDENIIQPESKQAIITSDEFSSESYCLLQLNDDIEAEILAGKTYVLHSYTLLIDD